jgi:hypothetical protein
MKDLLLAAAEAAAAISLFGLRMEAQSEPPRAGSVNPPRSGIFRSGVRRSRGPYLRSRWPRCLGIMPAILKSAFGISRDRRIV